MNVEWTEQQEKNRIACRKWRLKNLEYNRQRYKKYYKENAERRREVAKEYYEDNKEQISIRNHRTWRERKMPSQSLEYQIFYSARSRAKKYNLEFDIEVTDIIVPEYCPILGIKLDPRVGKGKMDATYSPSIDKVDPNRGYTKDNICVISMRANRLKNNGTLEELEAIVNYMKSYMK